MLGYSGGQTWKEMLCPLWWQHRMKYREVREGLRDSSAVLRTGCQSQTLARSAAPGSEHGPAPGAPESGIDIDGETRRGAHSTTFVWVDPS